MSMQEATGAVAHLGRRPDIAQRRPSDYRDAWDALVSESRSVAAEAKEHRRLGLPGDDPRVEANDAAGSALLARKDALAEKVWATNYPRDSADVRLLAEIAWDQLWGVAGIAEFPALPVDVDTAACNPQAVAALIFGVCDITRVQAGTRAPLPARTDVELELSRLQGILWALKLLCVHEFSRGDADHHQNDALHSLIDVASEQARKTMRALYPND
jgi:hypothetical protein